MTADDREREDACASRQDNSIAIDALENEDEDFVPPNPTSIVISPYNTVIDPTRLYFIAIGRGVNMAAKIKTYIRQNSDDQVNTLCSWWNPQSKKWEYIPKGYRPVPLTPPTPTPSMAEQVMEQTSSPLPVRTALVMASDAAQHHENSDHEMGGEDQVDEFTMDQESGERTALNLTPVPYNEMDENWDPVNFDVDMAAPASPSSGSNYSKGVRSRDRQRDKLRERNEQKGRQVDMNTDEEDIELDEHVLGKGPINDEDEGEDTTPRPSVPDSDQAENSDDENTRRLEVWKGKRRQVNHGDSSATAAAKGVGKNSKELEEGLQDLWITVTDKCRAMGKSPACGLKEAGFVISLSCRPNSWNVYRTWLCLQPGCPPGMCPPGM